MNEGEPTKTEEERMSSKSKAQIALATIAQKSGPLLDTVKLAARTIRPYLEAAAPHLSAAWVKGYKLYLDYWQDGYGEIAWCLMLIFFGGQFALTILAIQAFNQAGGSIIKQSLADLRVTFKDSMHNLQEDPDAKSLFDKDGDGHVTIEEVLVSFADVVTSEDPKVKAQALRMTSVGLKCIDPNRIIEAGIGFWAGFVAVIATLRSNLAKAVSNGAMIGEHVLRYVKVYCEKPLYESYPDHKPWVDAGLKTACAFFGIMISFLVVRLVSAFNSALQGAHRLSDIIVNNIKIRKAISMDAKQESTLNQVILVFLVFWGLNWQLSNGFSLPWYLRLVLLPLIVFESAVSFASTF